MPLAPRERYFFFALLIAAGIGSFIVLRPFLMTLFLGACCAVALEPLSAFLRERLRFPRALSALVTVLAAFVIAGGALYILATHIATESFALYHSLATDHGLERFVDNLPGALKPYVPQIATASADINSALASAASYLSGTAIGILAGAANTLFTLFLFAIALFSFLVNGERWARDLVEVSPLEDARTWRILGRIARAVSAILRGNLSIALLQGLVLGLGLWILGVPEPALWGFAAGIASLIPPLGVALVWVPAAAYLELVGAPLPALGLVAWGLVFGLGIDTLVKPAVMGKYIGLPPLATLFGALGGLAVFGLPGILIGPLALSLFLALVSIYLESGA